MSSLVRWLVSEERHIVTDFQNVESSTLEQFEAFRALRKARAAGESK